MTEGLRFFSSVEKTKSILVPQRRFSLSMPACPLGESTVQSSLWSLSGKTYYHRIWEEMKGGWQRKLFPEFSEWQAGHSTCCLRLPFRSSVPKYSGGRTDPKSHMQLTKPIPRKWPHAEYQLYLLPLLLLPSLLTYRFSHHRPAHWIWCGCWASLSFGFFPITLRRGQRILSDSPSYCKSHEVGA